ncbi:MAG: amidohydrolase [Ignavibacteria bacterium]|nr:amidohydrolase [Ignavibacteria bacterium]
MAQQRIPDVVYTNGRLWTVDKSKTVAEAVAIAGDRIIAVGSNQEILRLAGEETRRVDLGGKLMLPGFIDNHTHFMSGGFQLQSVDLRYAKNEEEFIQIIADRAKRYAGQWMTGGDWDHDNWPGGGLPTRQMIDPVTPNTPVFVQRYDGHMALANTYVLRLAGITKETPDPPGGTIVKDSQTGEPTGILKDEAMSLVYRHVPAPNEEQMMETARLALKEARRLGITSIQDISSSGDVRLYEKLKSTGELTARFFCRLPISQWKELAERKIRVPAGDEWVRVGSLKAFADGSLGSTTALFFEPYDSDPSTRGLPSDILLDGRLERWALEADKAGLQLSIHAIGDSANSRMLDLFEKIVRENPKWDRRFRIEHAQHLHPKDLPRFAALGVIPSMQPYHAIDDGRWADKRIGMKRCEWTYAFRSLIENGVRLSFGSDWTVAPLNPLWGIYAAVTRRTIDGANPNGWIPQQKISVEQAVEAYTINSAYAAFEEKEKGSISVGKLADLVVLSENIFAIDPIEIEKVEVLLTVVGGREVYRR